MAPDGSDVQSLALPALGGPIAAQSGFEDATVSRAACAAGVVVAAPAENSGLVRDCEALLELRDALFGSTLVNWGPGYPIAQWVGVTVAGAPLGVTGLILYALAPTGQLPPALGDLTQLRMLHLSYDQSHDKRSAGQIPPELGKLSHLRVLSINGVLTGNIPAKLGQLANLRILSLAHNQLTGEIPPELGRLTNLLGPVSPRE